jgi:hypothetical protein
VARGLSLAIAAVALAAIGVGGAAGATTSLDPQGTTLLDGQKVFPIVLAKGPEPEARTPRDTDALDEVVAAGVNVFKVGPATGGWSDDDLTDALAWSQAAAARDAYTWVNLATLSTATPTPGDPKTARLKEVVKALKDDGNARAIAMWKGADEPWWAETPAEQLRFAYCLSTSRGNRDWCVGESPVDSDHLWVTIQAPRGEASDLAPYAAVTDIHGVDHYPVTLAEPDPDLHEIGTWTDTLASITPNHGVWTTLQVCASGSGDGTTFVLPTRLQERYMIYDAIINGARSLAFYGGNIYRCWNDRDDQFEWNWTFWDDVLADLIREINAVSPIAPALVNPETTQVLTSSAPTTQVISRRGATSDDVWVIAAHSGANSTPVTIGGLPPSVKTGTVYTESRSVTAVNGSFTDTFDHWGVHVYHFRIEPQPPPAAPPPAPPPASPPPPAAPTVTPIAAAKPVVRLTSGRLASTPRSPRAGRLFTVRMRVLTSTGSPVRSGAVRCTARAGKTLLKPVSKRLRAGYAICAWKLPKAARGKRLRVAVVVTSNGQRLTRTLTRRIS